MNKLLAFLMALIFTLTACTGGAAPAATTSSAAAPVVAAQSSTSSTTVNTSAIVATPTVAEAQAANSAIDDDLTDYTWDSATAIPIVLSGTSISVSGNGVTVNGSRATITAAGTYSLSGTLTDGQISVDTKAEGVVQLVLNGVHLNSSTSAPIYIRNADKVILLLADNTENVLSDGANYVLEDAAVNEPNAALFSKADLTIAGNGTLTVQGNYNDGIASKDGLIIASGTLNVTAADDGIRGKDYLVIKAGTLTVTAQGDGLKSDNEVDVTKGYISIADGVVQVTSGGDAITAQTDVLVTGGTFTLTSGGGSSAKIDANTSAKGLKGVFSVNLEGGTFTLNAADDTLHSNGNVTVTGGTFNLASGDDALHADANLTINGGDIQITKSYEGLESAVITINGGTIHVISSDDGVNGAWGNDGSGAAPGGRPGRGPAQDNFVYTGSVYLYINGGYLAVDARGDGIDVNGAIQMTGGTVLINGPVENNNGALDYDATFNLTGGFLVAAGSAGMAQAPGAASTQYSLLLNLTSAQAAGTVVHIQNSAGEDILTFSPTKQYQSVVLSSPQLVKGETYTVYIGGTTTGTLADSLYQGGTYAPGTKYTTFTISNMLTTLGSTRNRP